MPAVTADPLTVPRLAALDPAQSRARPAVQVVSAVTALEGEGFMVRRPFPRVSLAATDPFLLLDPDTLPVREAIRSLGINPTIFGWRVSRKG